MIKHFIRRVLKRRLFTSPRIMICVPASATPVERRAVHEAGLSAGARRVYLIEEPIAAAIGAGNSFDEAIVNYVRFKYNLLIGATSAETIKKDAGCAIAKSNGERMPIHIKGRDLHRGFPADIILEPDDIPQALNLPIQQIVGGIRQALADVPPELTADICDSGIYLTGGGALLDRLDARLAQETGVKFKIAEDPLRCVARGP